MQAIYQLVIIALGAFAIWRGYRNGFARQIPALLAVVFAVCAVLLFRGDVVQWLLSAKPSWRRHVGASFIYSAVAAGLIYIPVAGLMQALLSPLAKLFGVFGREVLSGIAGAVASLARYMLALSVAYNMLIALDPECSLMDVIAHDDGNLAELVMFMAPAVMGYENFESFQHKIQLDKAKLISENPSRRKIVYQIAGTSVTHTGGSQNLSIELC